jgi:choline dehydrogenase
VGEFDFIVVGGGSGGNVVAARLVEAGHTVLVLEAGKSDRHLFVKAPAGLFMLAKTGRNLVHETSPQKSADGRPMFIPTGFTLGGGSSVNGMVYIRGQPEDYDDWRAMGNVGWGWDDVLPFFVRAENNQRLSNEMHGNAGPLPVSDPTHRHALSKAFVLAAQQAGHAFNHDFNQGTVQGNRHGQQGVGYYQTTTLHGERASTTSAYLSRVEKGGRLAVKVKSPVSSIVLEGRKAVGVRVRLEGGAETQIRAKRGVVLAAGALVTPKILMLSGIGPGAHLQAKGVPVQIDLPGVGKNMHDHLEVHVTARIKRPISMVGENKGLKRIRHGLEWLLFRQGMLTSNIVEVGGFFDTDGDGRPDVQIHVVPSINSDYGKDPPPGHGISLDPGFLRPKSRGEVLLRSPDPKDHALVDPHFLEAQEDVDALVRGVHLSRAILAQPALARLVTEELQPGPAAATDAAIERFVRANAKTVYHPVGTCRMGPDELGVVDAGLKLKGAENIWISDASVMPHIVSGNTNAPTIMIGERAADFISRAVG